MHLSANLLWPVRLYTKLQTIVLSLYKQLSFVGMHVRTQFNITATDLSIIQTTHIDHQIPVFAVAYKSKAEGTKGTFSSVQITIIKIEYKFFSPTKGAKRKASLTMPLGIQVLLATLKVIYLAFTFSVSTVFIHMYVCLIFLTVSCELRLTSVKERSQVK